MPVVTSSTVYPQVAHSDVTMITVDGLTRYYWARPYCIFGSRVVPATFVSDTAISCLYHSSDNCLLKSSTSIQISLYETQYSLYKVNIVHVCHPLVMTSIAVLPTTLMTTSNMTTEIVTVNGVAYYKGDYVRCRFGTATAPAVASRDIVIKCNVPFVLPSVVDLSVSNDGGSSWTRVTKFTFTASGVDCDAGYEFRTQDQICMPCQPGFYKENASADACTPCGT